MSFMDPSFLEYEDWLNEDDADPICNDPKVGLILIHHVSF